MAAPALTQALSILNGAAPVVALVGTRISPIIRTQDSPLPAITLTRIIMTPSNTFAGNGGLDKTRLQVDCWGATLSDADVLAAAVRAAFDAAQILFDNQIDGPFESDPVPGVYRVTQEYQFWS